jgi:hypothetical protein
VVQSRLVAHKTSSFADFFVPSMVVIIFVINFIEQAMVDRIYER